MDSSWIELPNDHPDYLDGVVKEELASQKSMFLLILKAMRNGQITNDVLDATEAALRRAGGDQVSDRSSGNDIDGQSGGRSTGPSTSHSQAN